MKQKTNPNDSITPIVETVFSRGGNSKMKCTSAGLTKREAFAMAAMQGIVSNHAMIDITSWEWLAKESVNAADAIIKALNE